MAWKIKVNSVAVPRALVEFKDEGGNTKYQHVSKVYTKGQVVPDDQVSPLIAKLYEDGDEQTLSVYEKVSDDVKEDIPPFDGYNDLDESVVRARMTNMTSIELERVKSYERDNQNRDSIVNYVTGFGESPNDRLQGTVPGQSGSQPSGNTDSAKKAITPKSSGKAEKVVAVDAEPAPAVKEEPKKEEPKVQKRTSSKKTSNSEE